MSCRVSRHIVVLAVSMLVVPSACKSLKPPFARLESAVVGDRYAASPAAANVRVVRGDSVVAPSISMRLLKGDSITTSATTRVVVTFAAGYEVTLDTNTAIYIENPSIFLRIGQAFIRRLRGTPDTLTTHTPQAVLHDAGTAFLVSVTPRATTVRVQEGAVDAGARDGGYPVVRYTALDQGEIAVGRGPQRMPKLRPAELETQLAWVRQVERISKVTVPQLDSMTEAEARAALERVGLRTLLVMHRSTGRYAPERVVETTPGAGEQVAPGTYVTLVLEKAGKTEDAPAGRGFCTVPGIVGKKENEAQRLLEAARFRGQATQRMGEIDVVTSQVEKAGSKLACGSTVHYTWGRVG